MSKEGRNPEGIDEPPATTAQSFSAAGKEDADRTMQSDSGNSLNKPAGEPAIDRRIQNHLGWKLKEAYDDLVRQPVPDKFHKLLEELERMEKKQ